MNSSARPKNLNLFTIRFPLPAIISILHRLSGLFLFLFIPFLIQVFSLSLTPDGFNLLSMRFDHIGWKLLLWMFLSAFLLHFFAGLRHLLMDIHIGTHIKSGKFSALVVLIITIFAAFLLGIWLW